MKAWVYEKYGSPEVLELRQIERPTPGDGDVLIRIHATSLNGSDWESLTGRPAYTRISGLRAPKKRVLGSDIAGTVEAVGSSVESFKPGDEVFGDTLYHGLGGLAEYACVPEGAPLVHKPPSLTFEQAAALPQAAVIAAQGILGEPAIGPGQKVMINGAGGAAGTFALQLAKSVGAEVTAVDNGHKTEFLASLGADHVIDYTTEDPTRTASRHDLVFDLAVHRSVLAYRRVMSEEGRYSVVGGAVPALLQAALLGMLTSRKPPRRYGVLAVRAGKEPLRRVLDLVESGAMSPIIDRIYSLHEVPEALQRLGDARALGKVVVRIGSEQRTDASHHP